MKVTVLGSGTSHGVPAIACECPVCKSLDSRDKRLRSSIFVESGLAHILVDIGPDFRTQALRAGIKSISAVLLTHSHADHLHGLDDIRIFSHTKSDNHEASSPMSLFGNSETLTDVEKRFDYVFHPTQLGGGKPLLSLVEDTIFDHYTPSQFAPLKITAIPMMHGIIHTTGYVFTEGEHSFAYLTDCNYISDNALDKVRRAGVLDALIIDGLKITGHSTHYSFLEAMTVADSLAPKKTYLTHICHKSSHSEIIEYINCHIEAFPNLLKAVKNGGEVAPSYDGQVITL